MTGKSNEKIELLIKNAFKQIFHKKITEDSFDEIDFKETLLKSMISHKIMTPDYLEKLILSNDFDPYTQKILIKGMEEEFFPRHKIEGILKSKLKNRKVSKELSNTLLTFLYMDTVPFKDPRLFVDSILNSKNINTYSVSSLMGAMKLHAAKLGDISKDLNQVHELATDGELNAIEYVKLLSSPKAKIPKRSELLRKTF